MISRRVGTSEAGEQAAVVRELRRARLPFLAVPNGGSRGRGEGARLKGQGVIPGVPDLLILGGPPPSTNDGDVKPLSEAEVALLRAGTALDPPESPIRRLLASLDQRGGFGLEMKRAGGRPSSVRPEQVEWLALLEGLGWRADVGFGAEDALRKLAAAGYPVRTTDQ